MRPIESAVFLALLISTVGLRAETESPLAERAARNSSRDVKVPRALVHQLETEYRAFLTKNEVSSKENFKRQLLNISTVLTQSHEAALHENTRINTPLGGGVVDLGDFVTPLRGAFSMKILARLEDGSEPDDLRVFFVSHAKKRVLDGDEYGAGCGKYMEITHYFKNRMSKSGFDLYTANQRYLSVVGGTFVTVAFDKAALHVASLTFTDSRYPDLLCE